MAKQLKSGASVPMKDRPNILVALNKVAADHSVDPAAIAGVIYTESVWDTRCVTGQYIGLTQVGGEIVKALGLTRKKFLDLAAPQQIDAYGFWLGYYKLQKKMAEFGIRLLSLSVARQAAVLQAMQFAPNAKAWKKALANGNLTVPSTKSPQAKALGDTSIGDMEAYYMKFFNKRPAKYE